MYLEGDLIIPASISQISVGLIISTRSGEEAVIDPRYEWSILLGISVRIFKPLLSQLLID